MDKKILIVGSFALIFSFVMINEKNKKKKIIILENKKPIENVKNENNANSGYYKYLFSLVPFAAILPVYYGGDIIHNLYNRYKNNEQRKERYRLYNIARREEIIDRLDRQRALQDVIESREN